MARLVVSVNLSDTGTRLILLQVNSDNDGPILYAGNRVLEQLLLRRAASGTGSRRYAQGIRCPASAGHETWQPRRSKVPFVTPASGSQKVPDWGEDGILATVLLQSVFVSHSDRFVIFDPR